MVDLNLSVDKRLRNIPRISCPGARLPRSLRLPMTGLTFLLDSGCAAVWGSQNDKVITNVGTEHRYDSVIPSAAEKSIKKVHRAVQFELNQAAS